MTPSTGPTGELWSRASANAVVGVASARAAQIAQDREEWFDIFFTLTVELRRCWQALARRVNDTRGAASGSVRGLPVWGGGRWTGLPQRGGKSQVAQLPSTDRKFRDRDHDPPAKRGLAARATESRS